MEEELKELSTDPLPEKRIDLSPLEVGAVKCFFDPVGNTRCPFPPKKPFANRKDEFVGFMFGTPPRHAAILSHQEFLPELACSHQTSKNFPLKTILGEAS